MAPWDYGQARQKLVETSLRSAHLLVEEVAGRCDGGNE